MLVLLSYTLFQMGIPVFLYVLFVLLIRISKEV